MALLDSKKSCVKSLLNVEKVLSENESSPYKALKEPSIDRSLWNSYTNILEGLRDGDIKEEEAIEQLKELEKLANTIAENPEHLTEEQAEAASNLEKSAGEEGKKGFPIFKALLCVAAVALLAGFIALCVLSGGIVPAALAIGAFAAHVAVPAVASFFVSGVGPFLASAASTAASTLGSAATWATVGEALQTAAVFTGQFIIMNPVLTGILGSGLAYGAYKLFGPKSENEEQSTHVEDHSDDHSDDHDMESQHDESRESLDNDKNDEKSRKSFDDDDVVSVMNKIDNEINDSYADKTKSRSEGKIAPRPDDEAVKTDRTYEKR